MLLKISLPKRRTTIVILLICIHLIVYIFLQGNMTKIPKRYNVMMYRKYHRWKYNVVGGVERHFDVVCPSIPMDLGPVVSDKWMNNLRSLEDIFYLIEPGGIYIPAECTALQTVAIVVPIPGNNEITKKNIGNFLYYIHPFLIRQQAEYQIFIIVKKPGDLYIRGELFNIGFKEAQAYRPGGWDCIIFHDIHLVPLDTRNLYRCSHHPRKLIADFQKPYRFGGAIAMRPSDFKAVNGFSNKRWSHNGEYVDMYHRLQVANFTLESNTITIGNYASFEFLRPIENRSVDIQPEITPSEVDGLSNVSYTINSLDLRRLYTIIEVTVEILDKDKTKEKNNIQGHPAANNINTNSKYSKISSPATIFNVETKSSEVFITAKTSDVKKSRMLLQRKVQM